MATIDLGKIKFNWRGTYAGGTAYVPDDVVYYVDGSVGSSYMCVANTTGNAPSSGGTPHASWQYLAKGQASSPTTTQGDLIVRGASADERLAIGAAGKALVVNSSANGLEYGTAGSILQVVSTTKTDTFSSNSDSFTDLTGLSVTITPISTSSKILIMATICFGMSQDGYGSGRLVRNGTAIGVAPAAGSRTVCGFAMQMNLNSHNKLYTLTYNYLDTPSYTLGDAITYKLQGRTYSGDSRYFTINKTQLDSNNYHHRGESRVIAMEVAA